MLRQRLKLECLVEPLIVQLVCCGKGMSEALGSIPSKRLWLPPPHAGVERTSSLHYNYLAFIVLTHY
jgi:hypothetical protein